MQLIQQMIAAALAAANPHTLTQTALANFQHNGDGRLWLLSIGKAGAMMATGAYDALGSRIMGGVVVSKQASATLPDHLMHYQGGHPIPNDQSLIATHAVEVLLERVSVGDHVLCLISGGASALLTHPALPLSQWQQLNGALIRSGCTINEINHVRQHFDKVKGGGLLRWAAPATVTAYILSDVIGNAIAHIGSGPTVPIERDVAQVEAILAQHNVLSHVDGDTRTAVEAHIKGLHNRPPPPPFPTVTNHIIGDVGRSAAAAAAAARTAGYTAEVASTTLTGEAQKIGRKLAREATSLPPGTCRIYGGETTVTLPPNSTGKGGRNQELALAAARVLADHEGVWLAAFATDGEDGPTDAAGAMVNGATVTTASATGIDPVRYLAAHDSYHFFERYGGTAHLKPGPTGTNVNDITIILREA